MAAAENAIKGTILYSAYEYKWLNSTLVCHCRSYRRLQLLRMQEFGQFPRPRSDTGCPRHADTID